MHAKIISLTILSCQIAFWKFDGQGAVLKYDAWLTNLNAWIEASTGVPISNPRAQAGTIQQLCTVTQQRCTGLNRQWSSIDQCVSALSPKPYGNYDEAWGDNIVCRTIHLVLTQVRPQVSSPLSSSAYLVAQNSNAKSWVSPQKNRSIAPMWVLQEGVNVWTWP